jgi:hypothetical protein
MFTLHFVIFETYNYRVIGFSYDTLNSQATKYYRKVGIALTLWTYIREVSVWNIFPGHSCVAEVYVLFSQSHIQLAL